MRIAVTAAVVVALALPAAAQERIRLAINAGQQATSRTISERQTFRQYLEEGSFTFERKVPKAPFYDVSVMIRVWRGLHAGGAVSMFEDEGSGAFTARVPHPFFFNQQREVTGDVTGVTRREFGRHISIGWSIPAADRLDVLVFGGPSSIATEQTFANALMLSLDKEVYPYDTLAFPGAVTETRRKDVLGYHAGADLTFRFTDNIGAGLLLRYIGGRKAFAPSVGDPVEVDVGGLHAGGGLRVRF